MSLENRFITRLMLYQYRSGDVVKLIDVRLADDDFEAAGTRRKFTDLFRVLPIAGE